MSTDVHDISVILMKISPDGMRAHVVLPRDTRIAVTPDDLKAALEESKISYGIREEQFDAICSQSRNGLPLLIATGKPPGRGEDGRVEILIEIESSRKPKVDEDGKANWYELNLVNNVRKGQILAKAIPPTAGEPGVNVTGKEIPGVSGVRASLPRGMNTRIPEDDSLTLVSSVDGNAVLTAGKINVLTTYQIQGSVDFSTGNINSVGPVKISGDVKANFSVVSEADVEVGGLVEDADIKAKGNILVKAGFVGTGNGKLTAGGNVVVRHVENQHIKADGNVQIEKVALNATIECKGKIIFAHPTQGSLKGGHVWGMLGIEAGNIGSDNEIRTEVHAGATEAMEREAVRLQKDVDAIEDSHKQLKTQIKKLAQKKYKDGLSKNKEEELVALKLQREEIPLKLEAAQKQLEEQIAEIAKLNNIMIQVKGKIHPNVRVSIGKYIQEFEHVRERVQLRAWGGKIVVEPLI